ncbi:hypothetical protein [Euzebya sp.]|uniref:hypothetical protein n=1 Tax=Euzebya sp. TaxID=1971409 RepID=UPI003510F690
MAGTHHLAATAARVAATSHDTAVVDLLADADLDRLDIDPPSGQRRPGDLVTVTVSRTAPVLWAPAPGIPLSAAATFRTEDVP